MVNTERRPFSRITTQPRSIVSLIGALKPDPLSSIQTLKCRRRVFVSFLTVAFAFSLSIS